LNAEEQLSEAYEAFRRTLQAIISEKLPDNPDQRAREKCERYIKVLNHIVDLIEFRPGYGDVALEIMRLSAALADSQRGQYVDFLRSGGVDSSPVDPMETWFARCQVCLGLLALTESGMKREKAVAHISLKYTRLERLVSGKTGLKTAIKFWDNSFRVRCSVKLAEPREVYNIVAAQIKQLSADPVARERLPRLAHHYLSEALRTVS
jgi:hypothetical protein